MGDVGEPDWEDLHRQSAAWFEEALSKGGFAVALSGGGHRATLMTLGAVLALVDRGLNRRVIQIASVSGGSITNAFLAHRCDFDALEPGDIDELAGELTAGIVDKGVLTRLWIILLLGGPPGLGIAAYAVLWRAGAAPVIAAAVGAVVALSLLLITGLVIEWLIDRRFFRHRPGRANRLEAPTRAVRTLLGRPATEKGRARVSSLPHRNVDHVVCATDLVLGLPVFVSFQRGGILWRQLGPLPASDDPHGAPFQTADAGRLSIAEIVRASAAFPGIPPRRLRMPPDPRNPLVAAAPSIGYLADGGMWNNLGTQVLREARFLGRHTAREDGVIRPFSYPPADAIPLLVVNGSAPQRPSNPWAYGLPGVAPLAAFLQTTKVLNANTVAPRVHAMRRSFARRVLSARRPDSHDPLDLVVDLALPDWWEAERPAAGTTLRELLAFSYSEESIRETDPAVGRWARDLATRVRVAAAHRADTQTDWLHYILQTPEPIGSFPAPGFSDVRDWDAVVFSDTWRGLVAREGRGDVDVPTTLGRIDPGRARALLARGYLNTFLASLYIAPLGPHDLDRLATLTRRLDAIVPPVRRRRRRPPVRAG